MALLWLLLGLALGSILSSCYRAFLEPKTKGRKEKRGFALPRLAFFLLLRRGIQRRYRHIYNGIKQSANTGLERKIETWQNVIQDAPIGYLQVDEDNRLSWCNRHASQLLDIPEIRDPPTAPRFLLQLVRSFELDRLIEQTRSAQKNLQEHWVFHHVIPDPLHPVQEQGLPLKGYSIPLCDGHVGIFIEDCLEAVTLAQQRDRWTSDVAHELKTPLTSIRLIAETLQERVDAPTRAWIDRLLSEAIRLSNLVQDLLELSQLDVGTSLKLNVKTFNLVQLIYTAWASLEPLATRQRVKLRYCGPSSLSLEADESRVHRLLLNLFDNSIKHSPPLQVVLVNVALEAEERQVRIEVIDSGPGFPEESLPYIFERFYRSDRSRVRSGPDWGGSGLGLAIVRQIVQVHRGTIQAQNHPETGGAWVKVNLPVESANILPSRNVESGAIS